MNWNNLLDEQCPMCGYFLNHEGTNYICSNHKKPFFIREERFTEIIRDLRKNEDHDTDFIKNLV